MSDISAIPALIAKMLSDNGACGIATLVTNRIYADDSPEVGKTYPQIVLSEDSGETESEYGGASGLVSANIEVDCLASTKAAAAALATAVYKLLADESGTWGTQVVQGCFCEDQSSAAVSIPEMGPDAKLYSRTVRFLVWFQFP